MSAEARPIDGKRVLLGVTGGIAAYKSLDVVGRLRDQGAEVRVVMTEAATKLVQPMSFQARSGHPVLTDMWEPVSTDAIEHIDYARWADLLLVAPITANTMAKFARGIADDLLSTIYLAYDGPVTIAPAMNTVMYGHPATRENQAILAARGVEIIEPDSGVLACGEIGVGKMAAVDRIVQAVVLALTRSDELANCRVLVTAGPTREYLDPVRYLTNPSSGKMGYALASEAARRGADVILISGPTNLPAPLKIEIENVVSAREMYEAVMAECDRCDILIFCAAVADYAPAKSSDRKLKKSGNVLTLTLSPTKDIAAETARQILPHQLRIGFAAETNDLEKEARRKLAQKKLDFIVANDVTEPGIAFGSNENRVLLIEHDGQATAIEKMPKALLARRLFDVFTEAWLRKRAAGEGGKSPRKRR